MEQTTETAIEWVRVKFLVAMLYLNAWREPGDSVAMPLDRAKKLRDQKPKPAVEFLGKPQFGEMPTDPKPGRKSNADEPPGVSNAGDSGGDEPPGDEPPGDADLESLGLPPKTIDLLIAGGIPTVEDLRHKIDDGFDLVSLDGIGKATADSIVAALNES